MEIFFDWLLGEGIQKGSLLLAYYDDEISRVRWLSTFVNGFIQTCHISINADLDKTAKIPTWFEFVILKRINSLKSS